MTMINVYFASNIIFLIWFYINCYYRGIDEIFKFKNILISFTMFLLFGLPFIILCLIEVLLENKTHDDF
jgi:hypothetical protein